MSKPDVLPEEAYKTAKAHDKETALFQLFKRSKSNCTKNSVIKKTKMNDDLNIVYCSLENKLSEIVNVFPKGLLKTEFGWYNGHYHKGDNDNWIREAYPIPVIGIKGLCDIEIRLDKISVSTKLQRSTALSYPFERLSEYEFEAYGVENYLTDFYHSGQKVWEMKDSIRACDEKEIGFSFLFPFDVDEKHIFEFVKLLCCEGFYY